MFDETLRSAAPDGMLLRDKLKSAGIIMGVKVDIGITGFPGSEGESSTQGLDNLAQRCKEYYSLGCRFAKWRAVNKIGPNTPTAACVQENAWSLARYGARPPQSLLPPPIPFPPKQARPALVFIIPDCSPRPALPPPPSHARRRTPAPIFPPLAPPGAVCQENGLVPIIEPEVLADGDHDIEARTPPPPHTHTPARTQRGAIVAAESTLT